MRKKNPKVIILEDNIDEEKKKKNEEKNKHEKVTAPDEAKQKKQKADYINPDFFVPSSKLFEQYYMQYYVKNRIWSPLPQDFEKTNSNDYNSFETNYKYNDNYLMNNLDSSTQININKNGKIKRRENKNYEHN